MGIRLRLSLLPSLLTGERVLLRKEWVWLSTGESLPGYSVVPCLPPLCEAGLLVTDRRVLYLVSVLRAVTHEFSQWFDGNAESEEDDSVVDVCVGKSPCLGAYLEVVSKPSWRRWYRSGQARVRLYMRHPESAAQIISEAMSVSGAPA